MRKVYLLNTAFVVVNPWISPEHLTVFTQSTELDDLYPEVVDGICLIDVHFVYDLSSYPEQVCEDSDSNSNNWVWVDPVQDVNCGVYILNKIYGLVEALLRDLEINSLL